MRKFIFAVVLLLAVVFFFSKIAEVKNILTTLERGEWYFLVPALFLQFFWLLNAGFAYKIIYRVLKLPEKFQRLFRMAAASTFLNVVAPAGGMSGLTVFLDDARKNNYSPARVLVAAALFVLFDFVGFLLVLALGLAVLARRNDLTWPIMSASIMLAVGSVGLGGLLFMGMRSGKLLASVLSWFSLRTNSLLRPIIKRDYIQSEKVIDFAMEIEEGLRAIKTRPKDAGLLLVIAIISKSLLIGILLMMFLAFNVTLTPGTLIAGFSIGYLFLIVSPTPSGIGFVEGALTLALSSFYVPMADATVIVVAYRGITLWLPILIGMIAFRSLSWHRKINNAVI